MRKVLSLVVVAYLFIASAIILTSKAQIFQDCRRIQSCSVVRAPIAPETRSAQ